MPCGSRPESVVATVANPRPPRQDVVGRVSSLDVWIGGPARRFGVAGTTNEEREGRAGDVASPAGRRCSQGRRRIDPVAVGAYRGKGVVRRPKMSGRGGGGRVDPEERRSARVASLSAAGGKEAGNPGDPARLRGIRHGTMAGDADAPVRKGEAGMGGDPSRGGVPLRVAQGQTRS